MNLSFLKFSSWTHYHEKLTGVKLLWKLLEIRMLGMSRIKNDHKKQENEGL